MATKEKQLDPSDLDRPDWNSLLKNYSKHDIGEAYFQGRVEQIGLHVEHWGIDKRHHDDSLIFDNKMDLRLWEPLDGQENRPTEWPSDDFTGDVWNMPEQEDITTPDVEIEIGDDTVNVDDVLGWQLRGIADVKTKASKSWLGKFNLRHLAHYAEWADHYGVPVFIYMTMVDTESKSVGDAGFLTPIPSNWEWSRLIDHYDGDESHSYGEMKDIARTCPIVHNTFRAPDGNLVVEIADDHKYNWDWFVENIL